MQQKIDMCQHTLQLLAEHGQENCEVDGAAGFLHHGLQLLILHIQLAHGGQHVPEVILADDAISVLVDDCESLPKTRAISQRLDLSCACFADESGGADDI